MIFKKSHTVTQPHTFFSCFTEEQLSYMFMRENWVRLDEDKRQDLLQEIVNRECTKLGDKFNCNVYFENMSPEVSGMQCGDNNIILNRNNFVFDKHQVEFEGKTITMPCDYSGYKAYETVMHEFRHVYQNMVSKGVIETDPYTKAVYESNNFTVTELNGQRASQYMSGYTGYQFYYLNPTELDARRFSEKKTINLISAQCQQYGSDTSMEQYRYELSVNGYEMQLEKCKEDFNNENIDKDIEKILIYRYNHINISFDPKLELMIEKEMIITQQHIDNSYYNKEEIKMGNKIDWANVSVSREEYNQTLRDSVNRFYEHEMNDPSISKEEAMANTAQMAENYENAMEEFDAAQAANNNGTENQSGMDNDNGAENDGGMDNDTGGIGDD